MNQVDYLRISLIDRCNFRCQYCMPEGAELDYLLKQELLTDEELLTLIQEVFIPVGFTRFRLTGGEPLLRPRVADLVQGDRIFTPNPRPFYDYQRVSISLPSPKPL